MSVVTELEEKAMSLTKMERGQLASRLIASLGSPFEDNDDDGIDEALRRSDELKNNPELGISIEDLDRRINERFGWKS